MELLHFCEIFIIYTQCSSIKIGIQTVYVCLDKVNVHGCFFDLKEVVDVTLGYLYSFRNFAKAKKSKEAVPPWHNNCL